MRPVALSGRLRMVVSMVTQGSRVCDVGCDHGFVSIYLVEQEISPHVLAMDVREGPLGAARKHVSERGLGDLIETRLSDGLHKFIVGEADSLICAGMGGSLMMRILGDEKAKTESFRELILQPQSEVEQFRAWLREQGYRITDEKMVEEDGKFYPMMRAVTKNIDRSGRGSAFREKIAMDAVIQEETADLPWIWEYIDILDSTDNMDILNLSKAIELLGSGKIEKDELCKLFDRYGAYLLLRGDATLKAWLMREERIYGEILEQLKKQGIYSGRRKRRYTEVENLREGCRIAQKIMGTGN